jgi:Zn-dependent protease
MVTAKEHFFPTISQLLYIFISTNLLLMVFNLIPIAPLDGEKILYYFLPFEGQQFMDTIRPYGPILLLALIFVLPFLFRPLGVDILSLIIRTPVDALTRLLIL